MNQKALISRGIRDVLPMFVPAIPFALVLGLVIEESGVGYLLGWATSPLIFGGAVQITVLSLLGEGVSVAAAVSAGLVVGARHLLYSATMAPRFQEQPRWFRWVGPYLLIDQVFALSVLAKDLDEREFRCYYLTIGLTFWSLWLLTTAVGLVAGPLVPAEWKLAFAAPVLFTALVVLGVDRWQKALVAILGASLTFLFASFPSGTGMLMAALCAIAIGMCIDLFSGGRS